MKFILSILGGRRQGDAFEIQSFDSRNNTSIFILEDEALEISFHSKQYYDKISLILHENEVEPTLVENHDDIWVYIWKPKRLGQYSYECFFHNYYGIAELALEAYNGEHVEVFNFQPIEILAKKINAERVESMLSFLARIDSEALCSFFRVTRRKAGYKHGDTPVEILLEQIESTVEKITTIAQKISNRPITKLSTKEKYIYPDNSTNVDDITLAWLCNNTDELFETDCIDQAILDHDNNLYGARKVIEYQAIEDSDVYENQILHGFINTLIHTASSLLSGFENPKKKPNKVNGTPLGYVSFFSQIQKFQKNINERKVLKCKKILASLHTTKRLMTEKIPAKKVIIGIPTFTMKAKKNPLYLSLFKKIVDWYRFGSPDWSVQEELLSIQSIPKLFEYYSLFYIKVILENKYSLKTISEPSGDTVSFIFNIKNDLELTLFYEPKYWMSKHPMADLRGLVNTEGWTIYNGKVSKRSNSGRFSNRSPDFVLRVKDSFDEEKFIILDAKYTYSDKAFMHYLPDLTLKYLHGLHSISKNQNQIIGLVIINPDEYPQTRDFHSSSFNIYSEAPAIPFMLCSSISPGNEFNSNNEFESALVRIISICTRQFKESANNIISQTAIRA